MDTVCGGETGCDAVRVIVGKAGFEMVLFGLAEGLVVGVTNSDGVGTGTGH